MHLIGKGNAPTLTKDGSSQDSNPPKKGMNCRFLLKEWQITSNHFSNLFEILGCNFSSTLVIVIHLIQCSGRSKLRPGSLERSRHAMCPPGVGFGNNGDLSNIENFTGNLQLGFVIMGICNYNHIGKNDIQDDLDYI